MTTSNSSHNSTTGDCAPDPNEPNGSDDHSKPSDQQNHPKNDKTISGGLYIVSTPIGHSRDISLRALETLTKVSMVACEDTRVSLKLMKIHGLTPHLIPYHDHNAEWTRPGLIKHLKQGGSLALISDAGTPLVSDPGYKLVRDCIDQNIPVTAVPGASSIMTALVISGLPTDRFLFEGFLPVKSEGRRKILRELAPIKTSLVFLESAKRLAKALTDMAEVLGDRPVAVTRELTKLHEQVRRGTLSELADFYHENGPPKGEITIVVGAAAEIEVGEEELEALLTEALETSSLRDAVKSVTQATGHSKKAVYAMALELSKNLPNANEE